MAVSLKHTTQATGTDTGNGEFRKAQWNEEHTLTAAANTLLGAVSAGAVGEITCTAAGRALLDDADAAAQRTTLGLGSAATLTAGTSANNLVQLDSSAKLPAVNGSQLTNLEKFWGLSLVDTQTFNSSGTWTKPSSGSFALVRCWGGGGSGRKGSSNNSSGGSGGAFHEYIIPLAAITNTVTVTVGAGGIAPTVAGTNGAPGGTTSFGSYVSANGGQGGTNTTTAGGTAAASVTHYVPVWGSSLNIAGAPPSVLTANVAGYTTIDANPNRVAGGAGTVGAGSNVTYSGGGGGGANASTGAGSGGTSTYGGSGGNGTFTSGAATSGSQPGGGGGGTYGGSAAGDGGAGRVIVYVF